MMRDPLQAVLLESFIDSWKGGRPSRLVLRHRRDRPTRSVRSRQEGRFFHGSPTATLLPAALHHLRRPPALRPTEAGQRGSRRRRLTGPLGRIVESDQRWPGWRSCFGPASFHAFEEILAWCEGNGVDTSSLARSNSRPSRRLPELAQAEAKRRMSPPVQGVRSRHPLVPQAPVVRQGRAPARQGQPALRGHLAARVRPVPSASTARGATWRTRLKERAADLFSADLGVALRRQPAPDPLLRLQPILFVALSERQPTWPAPPPERCGSSSSRSAPASRSRCGEGQGRHGLRTLVGRRLRTRPRPIARVTTPHAPSRSGDHLRRRTIKKVAQAAVPATLAPRKHAASRFPAPPAPPAETSAPTLHPKPSAVTV